MINQHRWYQLSFAEQLGNIGSELSRARHWESKQDQESRDQSLVRVLELLDLTLDDKRWKKRLKELTRLREVIGDWFSNQNYYQISPRLLEDYCVSFALHK